MHEAAQPFQITLKDFSGPLDMLWHLVESRSIDASSVNLTEILSQYVSYLLVAKKATLAELAEFFSLASKLLLSKVRSLLPRADESPDPENASDHDEGGEEDDIDGEELIAMLEKFKPYRTATAWLSERKEERDKSFVRISDEGGPPWFDIGDLYGLSMLGWSLMEENAVRRSAGRGSAFLAEIPDAVPEEVLVENRMGEILRYLGERGQSSLRGLLGVFGAGALIVTLLAMLELSRMGKIDLVQDDIWGDVIVAPA
jgi:segregation and condensation protein A